jgi:PLP dependent protein
MTNVAQNLETFREKIKSYDCTLVSVSKTKPNEMLMEAYEAGARDLGENKVQEMTAKYEELPKDIRWHMVGHLQRNKVKYIAPYVALIHSVDSFKLLKEIDKQGRKAERVVPCLLQMHIAEEESKFGLDEGELMEILESEELPNMEHVRVEGLMGMATFTENHEQVRNEFKKLKAIFNRVQNLQTPAPVTMKTLSMGMSGDYPIALEEGSNMIRIGTHIFGARK